jgi:lipoprotein-releasing system permease protein
MLSWRIAGRFLRASPVQSALIICGIAVGIAVQVFVGSLIQSLQASLIDQTIGSSPHVTLQALDEGDPIVVTERLEETIAGTPEVEPGSVAKVRLISGLYSEGEDSAPLNLVGGEPRGLDGIYNLSDRIVEGSASLRTTQILIGTDFAEKYDVGVGDEVTVAFTGGQVGRFRVAGTFDLGAAAANERQAFVNEDVPRDLLGWSSSEYSAVYTQMEEPFTSAEVAAEWRRKLPGVEIVDWQSQNADLLTALQSQSQSSYLIQTFVLVAVALGIASTLAISAVQKTRQIGILKAMGMHDGASGRIFLFEALILGGLGAVAGVALAYALIAVFSFAPVPFEITPQWQFVLFSAAIGVSVALASSIIPTRQTSKLDPIEVIQSG